MRRTLASMSHHPTTTRRGGARRIISIRHVRLCVLLMMILPTVVLVVWLSLSQVLLLHGETNLRQSKQSSAAADGTLNNVSLSLRRPTSASSSFHSTVHCIGATPHNQTAWQYRSCLFHNLCLDTTTHDFFVVAPPDRNPQTLPRQSFPFRSSTSLWQQAQQPGGGVALGGINPRWTTATEQSTVQWFPQVVSELPTTSYYMLPDHVVLLPFTSFAAHNVGHLLWDDFYPMYQLLSLFGLISTNENNNQKHQFMLLRVDTLNPPLYGTCDKQWKHRKQCARNFQKWLPLMGIDPRTFSTLKRMQLIPTPTTTSMVCARTAVAGMGMLTDHGINDHGWNPAAETVVQNTGKGTLLHQFRNFMLHNLHLPTELSTASGGARSTTFRMVLSAQSSSYTSRSMDFQPQYNAMVSQFSSSTTARTLSLPVVADIQRLVLSQMSVMEQVSLISQTHVLVSVCGGGTMTATFLPRGASLILYYNEDSGFDFHAPQQSIGGPAFLDWDLFHNAGYLRVHWLPMGSMNTPEGIAMLLSLIRHEMEDWAYITSTTGGS